MSLQNKIIKLLPTDLQSQFKEVSDKFQINTVFRCSHFLGQCAHESNNFKTREENLNYSAKGLMATFPKYFPTEEIAKNYERQPEKIANLVYGRRMGNGAIETGDGYKFRGRGLIQLTGKVNYGLLGESIGKDFLSNPELLINDYAMISAGWYWNDRKLNSIADRSMQNEIIMLITKKINGGFNGLEDRIKKTMDWYYKIVTN